MRTPSLDGLTLGQGSHDSREEGMCAMEAAAWLAGEEHTDEPECVSEVIGAFMRTWNDSIYSTESRTRLLAPLLPEVIGTSIIWRDEERRARMAADWLVRECAPAWLERAGLTEHAARLRSLPEFVDRRTVRASVDALEAAEAAVASRITGRRPAKYIYAADDARRAAAMTATRDAAMFAMCDGVDIVDTARYIAADAVLAAALAAAPEEPEAALQPTVEMLQTSAQDLVRRMCAVGRAKERGKP